MTGRQGKSPGGQGDATMKAHYPRWQVMADFREAMLKTHHEGVVDALGRIAIRLDECGRPGAALAVLAAMQPRVVLEVLAEDFAVAREVAYELHGPGILRAIDTDDGAGYDDYGRVVCPYEYVCQLALVAEDAHIKALALEAAEELEGDDLGRRDACRQLADWLQDQWEPCPIVAHFACC
jgi:hypothetical protein